MDDRLSEIRNLVEKKKQKAEEHKKIVEAGEVRSETETELRQVALGAEKAVETVWDTMVDITGSDEQRAKTYKELTGRDTKEVEKNIDKYSTHGSSSGSQKMLQQIAPEVAATVLTSKLAAMTKIGRVFDEAGAIKRTAIVSSGGAVENIIADALSQNLTPEGETSLVKAEPSKIASSAAIGASVVGGIYAGGKLTKEILGATPSIVSTVEQTSNKMKENVSKIKSNYATKMDKDGESIFSKLDPTARRTTDIAMAKRVGRTATRIAVRLAGREAEHMYNTFKDIGKEIYQESTDLIKTKYNNVKNIDINKVANEVLDNIKNKSKPSKEATEAMKTDKTTYDKAKEERSYIDDLPHSYKDKILNSDYIQSAREKFSSMSDSKVFTDNLFSSYVEIAGDKAKKALQELDEMYVNNGKITGTDIKTSINKVFDAVEEKLNIKRERPNNLNDILKPMTKDNGSIVDDSYLKPFNTKDKLSVKPITSIDDIKNISKNSKNINETELDSFEGTFKASDSDMLGLVANKDKELINKLIELSDDPKVYITKGDMRYSGLYNKDTNEISLNPTSTSKGSDNLKHELFHSATVNQIRKYPKLYKELEDIYNRTLKNVQDIESKGRKIDNSTKQWRDNADEFFAEAMTNPLVMRAIERSTEKNKGLINRIKQIVMRALRGHLPPKDVNELFNKLYKKEVLKPNKKTIKLKEPEVKKNILDKADEVLTKGIDKAERKILNTLADNNIFKVSNDGKVTVVGLETDSFKSIMNDLGLSNKELQSKIVDLRNKTQGMVNHSKMVSKAIAKVIKNSGLDNKTLESINYGRVATAIKRNGSEFLTDNNLYKDIANKLNMSEKNLMNIIEVIGEGASNKRYKNVEQAFNFEDKLSIIKNKPEAMRDLERAIAKYYYDKSPFDVNKNKEVLDTIADVERIENSVFNDNIQFGYSGFYSPYKVEIKVSSSRKPIEGWNQVADSNTFYRLDLDGNVSDGIVPISNDAFQGTIITNDIQKNIARLKRNNIPYGLEMSKDGEKTIRLYPDNRLAKELRYEEDMSKRIANKYITLTKNIIRNKVIENIDDEVRSLFSKEPKEGYDLVDADIAPNFKKLFPEDLKDAKTLFVKKEFNDILVGAKETLLYNGNIKQIRAAEQTYKDMVKRFKRGVTVKSVSSVVNNYLVIPSVLKGNGIPLRDIPSSMKDAHIDYADFVNGIEKYQELRTKNVKAANSYLKNFMETNYVAKLAKDGGIQSAVDDALISIANETDHIHYGIRKGLDKYTNKKVSDTITNVVDFVSLAPNTTIGSFMMNKFVMTDVVGRISLYKGLLKQGKTHEEALGITNDMFVNFSIPYPKSIRVLEEYGVPFVGWMYRMQLPLYKMAKNNPTSVATVVGLYLAMESIGNSEGHMGDLKIDSWFIHNSFADSNILYSAPLTKGEFIPDIKPQLIDEAIGVAKGDKSPIELLGFNIK